MSHVWFCYLSSCTIMSRFSDSFSFAFLFFFFTATATTEIYTLSLHDALPICGEILLEGRPVRIRRPRDAIRLGMGDRKSTRLNSSHTVISYAVFCLKKKNREAR